MAGLFFCLASDTVQGFSFCPAAYRPRTSVYSGFSAIYAIIPPTPQNSTQGFTAAFPFICPIPAHTIQQSHKPLMHHLRHAGGHTIKRSTPTDTRYYRHARRCTDQHSRPIIIRYIRVRPCYGSMPDSAADRRPYKPGGVSSYRLRIAGKC